MTNLVMDLATVFSNVVADSRLRLWRKPTS